MPAPFKNVQEIHDELTDLLSRVESFWLDQDEHVNAARNDQAAEVFNAVEQAVMAAEAKDE